METNNVVPALIPVSHSDISNLKERATGEVHNVIGNIIEPKNAATSSLVISLNDLDNESREKEDDQDSVIIEELENKPIELNEDSDEETELNRTDQRIGDLLGATNNSVAKDTEFVIVNDANMSTVQIADVTEGTNRYAIEDIQIKDELAESISADLNTNDVLENDPMDLLELNNRSECASSPRSHEDTDDYGDDVSSIGSSSVQTGSSSSLSVQDWVKDYPWLLYEERDEPFGYCLYCDTKVNTKSQRSVKQHGLSLYHKERCDNYLAFREEEEKNGLSMKLVEIKEEFGTDSRVEALKLKRKSQSAALNNFIWRRWLEDYPWLERDSAEGTIGFCKYCLLHVNVEFSYLRDRHQEGAKHKDAEKHYEGYNEQRDQSKTSSVNEEKYKEPTTDNIYAKSQRWIEFVEKEPAMARCKICGTKMFKNNFLRHLRTNLHVHNEKIYLQNQKSIREKDIVEEPTKNQQYWKLYTKRHPWLVADPADSSFAYCKYCEKRVIYGTSAAKRATHENSSHHKQNESLFKNRSHKVHPDRKLDENNREKEHEDVVQRNNEEDEDEIDDENADENEGVNEEENEDEEENEEIEEYNEDNCENVDEDNEHDNEDSKGNDDEKEQQIDKEEEESQQEKESHDDNESKKRVYKLTDEWINQYSWCKRYGKDPTNFIYCIYCKIPLSVSYSRLKHQSTSFHISAEREFLDRQSKKQKKQSNENLPFFEWAVPLKNNPSSYSCRYCRVRISKNYSKKQHEASKIHQINESIYKNNRRKPVRKDENTTNHNNNNSQQLSNDSTRKLQAFSKVVLKSPSTVTLIKQWQKKFPWLSYKRSELRSHYGHCKVCNSSLYIRSLKHVLRHVRSGRHISVIKAKKMQKVEKDQEVDDNETSGKLIKKGSKEELQTSSIANCDSSQNQTKLSTKIVASETQPYESQKAYSYKSTITEMRKRFSWIENSDRPNYAFCRFCDCNIPLKVLFLRNHSNSRKHRHCVVNYYSADGKKVAKEVHRPNKDDLNDNESKVGDADDDVIIIEDVNEKILISEQDENWTVKSETMDEHEELDYLLERSFNNTQQQSNVQSNMPRNRNVVDEPPPKRMKRPQSFRRFNDSNASLVASLLTTPLTLASCLGPLIQQQIQHHVNIPQTSQTRTNESATDIPGVPKISTAAVAEPGNTYDLFFKSVSETMKKLPADLATEGKLRVMQVICDLELQALKRQQSAANESLSSNASSCLSYQAPSTSSAQPGCGSSVINDINSEQNANNNETIIAQLNMGTDMSPTSSTNLPTSKATNQCVGEKPANPSVTSPIIGVMDMNGLQTLQLKTSISKHIPRNTTATTITTVANSGIRCIPFKNLSQSAIPDTSSSSNTKITRIQVPINVPAHAPNQNTNSLNNSKNLINFRNIQITKRIATPPTTSASHCEAQNPVQPASTMTNKNSQIPFITNFQPQLQRWSCSVNGATSQLTSTSPAVNQLQQLPPQHSSTPVSRK